MKIVTIGGGSGQSQLLTYLKQYDLDITAIVSMVDDGGSTGQLRSAYGVMPPGDIRRCVAALSPNDHLAEVLEYRFDEGDLAGHPVGNIVLSSYEQGVGNISQAVDLLCQLAECQGRVIPVTNQLGTLHAELLDGSVITGETHIDNPSTTNRSAIKRVYLDEDLEATPEAIIAIEQADYIIFTIGDLYTSIIPNLLIRDIPEAISRTAATKVYTANRLTKQGETDSYSVLQCIQELERYMGGAKIDAVVIDPTPPLTDNTFVYNKAALEAAGVNCVEADVLTNDNTIVSGEKLAKALANYCK